MLLPVPVALNANKQWLVMPTWEVEVAVATVLCLPSSQEVSTKDMLANHDIASMVLVTWCHWVQNSFSH